MRPRPLALCALSMLTAGCDQDPEGAEARRIVEEWTGVGDRSESVARFYERARRGCDQGLSGIEYGACQTARLALAEVELADAERGYLEKIETYSATYRDDASFRREYVRRWTAVFEYGQRWWREGRDADCAAVGFSFTGGSGAGAGFVSCQSDRTFERAERVRAM